MACGTDSQHIQSPEGVQNVQLQLSYTTVMNQILLAIILYSTWTFNEILSKAKLAKTPMLCLAEIFTLYLFCSCLYRSVFWNKNVVYQHD